MAVVWHFGTDVLLAQTFAAVWSGIASVGLMAKGLVGATPFPFQT